MWPNRHDSCRLWTPNLIKQNDYEYKFDSYGNKRKRRVFYRCVNGNRSQKEHCTAVAYADFSEDLLNYRFVLKSKHTCTKGFNYEIPYYTKADVLNRICQLYLDKAYNHMPDQIYVALLQWIDETTPRDCNKNIISQQEVRNYVHRLNTITQENIISFEKSKTLDNNRFLLFQIACGTKHAVAFSSDFMLSVVHECTIIGIDSTFYSAPNQYSQLCVFMGRSSVMNIPLLFLLLPDKKEETYCYCFENFKRSLSISGYCFHNNVKFVCDFELAEVNGIKKTFLSDPNLNYSLQLCYFHYCKAITKKFIKIFGNSPPKVEKELKKILLVLPLLEKEIVEDFIDFLPSITSINQNIAVFINYYIRVYVRKFSINDWNISKKPFPERATNNVNESYNRKLNCTMTKNPSVLQFYLSIQKLENESKNKFNNLKLNNSLISKDYLLTIEHNERIRFLTSLEKLRDCNEEFRNQMDLFTSDYFGIKKDLTVRENITNFVIKIPRYYFDQTKNVWMPVQK